MSYDIALSMKRASKSPGRPKTNPLPRHAQVVAANKVFRAKRKAAGWKWVAGFVPPELVTKLEAATKKAGSSYHRALVAAAARHHKVKLGSE
jgi:hypothetical protein